MVYFCPVKRKLFKILAFILLLSFTVETTGAFWLKQTVSTEMTEKDEKGKSGDPESEKQDNKDKAISYLSQFSEISTSSSLFVAANTFVKYAAWFSLPEIPPETT